MKRDLTIGDQRLLARALRSSSVLVRSDNITPVNINILPMTLVVDTETIDRCIKEVLIRDQVGLSAAHARDLVLSVLRVAADIGRGTQTESQVGGDSTSDGPSGSDHI